MQVTCKVTPEPQVVPRRRKLTGVWASTGFFVLIIVVSSFISIFVSLSIPSLTFYFCFSVSVSDPLTDSAPLSLSLIHLLIHMTLSLL